MDINNDNKKMKKRKTICLNMIVKNEENVIKETLENLCFYINFDYWVISDTGSTDQTKEIIKDFFKGKDISGELLEHEWKDFGYNRTKALECAFNKTDYLLIFDADDRIAGDFKLPLFFTADKYNLKIGKDFEYVRPLLINNRKRWMFQGILHEFLLNIDKIKDTCEIIDGDYYIIHGTFGNRSTNPNKYLNDATILKNGFEKEYAKENGDLYLADRYAFYCAQSYRDCGLIDEAILWYTKVLELNNWIQEKYYSCYTLGELYKIKNDNTKAVTYWLKTLEYDPERIEGLINAVEYYYSIGEHIVVNALYHRFKNYNKNLNLQKKLFVLQYKYTDLLEYYNSISAYYANDKKSGYLCCKKIILNNVLMPELLKKTYENISFYKDLFEKDEEAKVLLLKYKDNLLLY